MPTPPSYRKVNPADQPILFIALYSSVLPLSTVSEHAETTVAQSISMINGVAQVQVYGSQKYAVRAMLDPNALAARGIGLNEVTSAIQGGNVNLPVGDLQGERQSFTLQSTGQLERAADYGPLIVAWRNGAPVRLGELGEVSDSVENDKAAAWFNKVRGIILPCSANPEPTPSRSWMPSRNCCRDSAARFPVSVGMDILYDRSASIRESRVTSVYTGANGSAGHSGHFPVSAQCTATIIPSLALIPVIGTFAGMYMMGFNIDNFSPNGIDPVRRVRGGRCHCHD